MPPTPLDTFLSDLQPYAWPAAAVIAALIVAYGLTARRTIVMERLGGFARGLGAAAVLGTGMDFLWGEQLGEMFSLSRLGSLALCIAATFGGAMWAERLLTARTAKV